MEKLTRGSRRVARALRMEVSVWRSVVRGSSESPPSRHTAYPTRHTQASSLQPTAAHDARASRTTGSRKNTTRASGGRATCRCGLVRLAGSGRASRPRTARQARGLPSCAWHFVRRLQPTTRFPAPLCTTLIERDLQLTTLNAVADPRARRAKPGAEGAAKAERSECRGGRTTRWGRVGWM